MAYRMKDHKMTVVDAVKEVLRKSGGEILTSKEIEQAARMRRRIEGAGSVSRAVCSLHERGLVERVSKGRWRWIGDDKV